MSDNDHDSQIRSTNICQKFALAEVHTDRKIRVLRVDARHFSVTTITTGTSRHEPSNKKLVLLNVLVSLTLRHIWVLSDVMQNVLNREATGDHEPQTHIHCTRTIHVRQRAVLAKRPSPSLQLMRCNLVTHQPAHIQQQHSIKSDRKGL